VCVCVLSEAELPVVCFVRGSAGGGGAGWLVGFSIEIEARVTHCCFHAQNQHGVSAWVSASVPERLKLTITHN
jgi:hypothetical protein